MTCAVMKTSSSLHIKWRVLTQAALHNKSCNESYLNGLLMCSLKTLSSQLFSADCQHFVKFDMGQLGLVCAPRLAI